MSDAKDQPDVDFDALPDVEESLDDALIDTSAALPSEDDAPDVYVAPAP